MQYRCHLLTKLHWTWILDLPIVLQDLEPVFLCGYQHWAAIQL